MKAKLVLIGGGTGSFNLLSELKKHPFDITALVNMADSGGSTGVLRDELGVLPPGDVRQCLVALSESPQILRDLFTYRFPNGSTLAGHSFGNLFLSAFEDMSSGDFAGAIQLAEQVLNIKGRVLPITLDNCHLVMQTDAGVVKGEHHIDTMRLPRNERPQLALSPRATLHAPAEQAIKNADIIVIAPGDIYTSLGPSLIVDGVKHALAKSRAKKIYVCNLVNKPGHTDGFTVADYAEEIERLAGLSFLDYVLYNTERPERGLLHKYEADQEFPVLIDEGQLLEVKYKAVGGKFIADTANQNKGQRRAAYIRHDAENVVNIICKLLA
mgnify:CR=1 FL=1